MSHLIIATILYIAIVAIAYCPKTPKNAINHVDYFPEVEKIESDISGISEPTISPESSSEITLFEDRVTELEPVTETAIASETATSNLYLLPPVELESLSIRELKKLASEAKIKRYSTLNKRQLVQALAA